MVLPGPVYTKVSVTDCQSNLAVSIKVDAGWEFESGDFPNQSLSSELFVFCSFVFVFVHTGLLCVALAVLEQLLAFSEPC